MLHMLVNTHNAESCAFRSKEDEDVFTEAIERLSQVTQDRGVTLKGSWVNTASHTIFMLMDAPSAHAVDEVIREAGMIGRSHTQVFAVGETQALFGLAGGDR